MIFFFDKQKKKELAHHSRVHVVTPYELEWIDLLCITDLVKSQMSLCFNLDHLWFDLMTINLFMDIWMVLVSYLFKYLFYKNFLFSIDPKR